MTGRPAGDGSGRAGLSRDRDPAGRPRNARPRDGLGRPLPRGAAGAERIPDDLDLPPAEAIDLAQRLLDTGRPFHAHEVLEASWKHAAEPERALWRGLAQLAVGLTHAQRGNSRGAAALLRRGAAQLRDYAAAPPYDLDIAGLIAACTELAAQIEEMGPAAPGTGPAAPSETRPQIRLTRH